MEMIRRHLAMSPAAREAFEAAERARERQAERMANKGAGADQRIDAAEARRLRRQARNLRNMVHCS